MVPDCLFFPFLSSVLWDEGLVVCFVRIFVVGGDLTSTSHTIRFIRFFLQIGGDFNYSVHNVYTLHKVIRMRAENFP